jgi:phosphate transport system permease protein
MPSTKLPSQARVRGRPDPGGRSRHFNLSAITDQCFHGLCGAAAWSVILVALALATVLFWKSWLAIRTLGLDFFRDGIWDPVNDPNHRHFGALAFIYGTLATSAVAMLVAVPLGIGSAAFLSEIATGWFRRAGAFLVEMLAAIPSVVYGFWGIFFLAPVLKRIILQLGGPNEGGLGILAAGLILAIMIMPYIAAVTLEVCRAVPSAQREGSLALGASRWQTTWRVVLPYASSGIIGGCFLALGRALGETMAVTMLIGNRPEIPQFFFLPLGVGLRNVVFGLGDSIASAIANQYTEATYPLYLSALTQLGLLLLLVTVTVNAIARVLIWRVGQGGGKWGLRQMLKRLLAAGVVQKPVGMVERPPPRRLAQYWTDRLMTCVLGLCLAIALSVLFLILGYLTYQGVGALDWKFFVNLPVGPGEKGGGMANAMLGSLLLVGMASFCAVPVGLLAAIYLAEYRTSRVGASVRFIGELLAGVPSIVIGIFAAVIVAVPTHLFGWAGSFALAVMMLPIVLRASEEALKLVPGSLRDASAALGARRWQTIVRVVVPTALPAITTAVFLAVARISGETAPLLLTAGDSKFWPRHFLNDYTASLPVYVFEYAKSPFPEQNRQAWAAAFVLLTLVMLLNVGVRLVSGRGKTRVS